MEVVYVVAKRKHHNGELRRSVKGCSKKFLRMSEVYRHFAREAEHCLDLSDEALLELYNYESFGGSTPSPKNGFYFGKRMLNLNVTMWKEDIERSILFKWELYDDPSYPHWWLDQVISDVVQGCKPLDYRK